LRKLIDGNDFKFKFNDKSRDFNPCRSSKSFNFNVSNEFDDKFLMRKVKESEKLCLEIIVYLQVNN
jgi:hypothetical protein